MKILEQDKDFADAVKNGQKIKTKKIFYTGNFEQTVKDDEVINIGDYVEGKGVYAGKIKDSNGKNSKKLFVALKYLPQEMTWNEAREYKFDKGYKLPNIRELSQIYHYKDAIKKGLRENGGDELKENYYWSSTETSSNYAWRLHFVNGYRYGSSKNSYRYVRPVLAL